MKKSLLFSCILILSSVLFAACGGGSDGQSDEAMMDSTDTAAVDTLNFGPINRLSLNDAAAEDFARIPGVGRRMVREFLEYRPYVSIEQFRSEMGKYVDAETIAGYEKYLYVSVDYNASDAATLLQIPGVSPEMAQALIDARPYESREAFLGKVTEVAGGVTEQFARHFLIQE